MALIRASCTTCGDVELTTADVQVRVCTTTDEGEYSFRCPICEMTTVKAAEARTIDLLIASGVAMSSWTMPAEVYESHHGDPINHDDLIDFHRVLHEDGALEQAVGSMTEVD